jgi:hypothetical protein
VGHTRYFAQHRPEALRRFDRELGAGKAARGAGKGADVRGIGCPGTRCRPILRCDLQQMLLQPVDVCIEGDLCAASGLDA